MIVPPLVLAAAFVSAVAVRAPSAGPPEAGILFVLSKRSGFADRIDLASGRRTARVEIGPQPHEALMSADGRFLHVSLYGSGALARLALDGSGSVVRIPIGDAASRPHGLFEVGDDLLVTAEGIHRLFVLDRRDGSVRAGIETDQEIAHMVVATPDGRFAFTANIGSGSLARFDLRARRQDGVVATGAGAEGIALSPDGREVWVANRADDSLSVVDACSLEILARLDCASFPIRCAFVPDGSAVLVTCARSGHVVLVDARSRREKARLDLTRFAAAEGNTLFGEAFAGSPVPIGLLVDPEGRFAYVACSAADRVVEIDLRTFEPVRSFPTGREPDGLALLPGRRDV